MKTLIAYTTEEFTELLDQNEISEASRQVMDGWLARGDGVAVYENVDLGSYELGHLQFVSFGSPAAQLEVTAEELPERLPDIGNAINWRYRLKGVYRQ